MEQVFSKDIPPVSAEREMEEFFSMSYLMARVRNRQDLLRIINVEIKKLLPFNFSTTTVLSEDKQSFSMFLLDPPSQASSHPDDYGIAEKENPGEDNVFNRAIAAELPVVFDVAALIAQGAGHYPPYIQMYHESGIRELVAVPLRNEKEPFGLFVLYADQPQTFTAEKMMLIRGIGNLVSIAIMNILATEAIHQRELEKEMLLSLSHDMAAVRDKDDLLCLINTQLKKLVAFDHSNLFAINEDRQTFSAYKLDPASTTRKHQQYESLLHGRFSIFDPILDEVMTADKPLVFNLQAYAEAGKLPAYLVPAMESGMRETVLMSIAGEPDIFGFLSFFSATENNFSVNHLNIIKAATSQLSTAIANIITNENLRKRNLEKETLLNLSHDIARIRDKNDLLTLINTRLKELFYFTHS